MFGNSSAAGRGLCKTVLTGAAIFCLGAGAAFAQDARPDLIINVDDSVIRAGTCSTEGALATGRVAIKNIGNARASMKIQDRLTRSMLAVFVPENIDMVAKVSKGEQLDAFDQEGIEFSVGAGVEKRGRFFGDPPFRVSTAIRTSNTTDRTRAIQRALTNLGFDTKGIDGVYGSNTRSAAAAYQRAQKQSATGNLTEAQVDRLLNRSGETVAASGTTGARGKIKVTLYAVVDPYNLVKESNEANNIIKFTVDIDCSR
ncbi:MAG: hypothetical protein RLZ98_57 [Pseudomonadota bacterium]|jgi:hypothetical protein